MRSGIRSESAHLSAERRRAIARGVLGFCLTRARRFAEAEPVLLQAEAGLRRLSPAATRHHNVLVTWLVGLYEQWGKAEQAALWKERLARRP